MALPTDLREIADRYTFTPADLDLIAQRRGEPNRMGFAIQTVLSPLSGSCMGAGRTGADSDASVCRRPARDRTDQLSGYAVRDETRREHLAELVATFDWRTFGRREHRETSAWLLTLARGMDRGLARVRLLLEELRQRRILAPALSVIDRLASAVRHRARREAYRSLTVDLSPEQRVRLDDLLALCHRLQADASWVAPSAWRSPNPGNILKGIERLSVLRKLGIPGEGRGESTTTGSCKRLAKGPTRTSRIFGSLARSAVTRRWWRWCSIRWRRLPTRRWRCTSGRSDGSSRRPTPAPRRLPAER